ncbi:MAG: cell division protein FtsA [Clostridia bacterium]|nr:cell division protein FtsA [Clostridia bacterium]
MAIGDIIVGIDIGTSKVCCCLGQINKFNQVEILNSSSVSCDGFKKGKIVSVDAVARAIRFAITDIETTQDFTIKSAYVNIVGKYVSIFKTKYSIKLEDKYDGVSQKNIDTIIQNVGNIEIPEGQVIIDIVPSKFITDTKVTDDPIGIFTDILEAELDVIIADEQVVKTIGTVMQKVGLAIDGIVINGFALKDIVLTDEEKEKGVLLLDIGAGNIDISVFRDNGIIYTDSIPIGGDTITNDISVGLDISYQEADKLKKQYGLASAEYIDNDYNITLTTYNGEEKMKSVKCSELVEIIEARVEEMFTLIKSSIDANNLQGVIQSCVIYGQGINSINKSEKIAEKILRTTVRFGNSKTANLIKPECAAAYGIVKYISNIKHSKNIGSRVQFDEEPTFMENAFQSIKNFVGSKISKFRK